MTKTNVFLVGPMGAGKTTIGKQLAKNLGLTFKDTDHEIERKTGANIPWIFDIEGEQGFRLREKQMLAELVNEPALVLATGGGIVLDEKNRTNLQSNGTVIYLCASVAQQLRRTRKDTRRPLLQTKNPKAKLTELLEKRDPLYRGIADIIINTDRQPVKSTVARLVKRLKALSAE